MRASAGRGTLCTKPRRRPPRHRRNRGQLAFLPFLVGNGMWRVRGAPAARPLRLFHSVSSPVPPYLAGTVRLRGLPV